MRRVTCRNSILGIASAIKSALLIVRSVAASIVRAAFSSASAFGMSRKQRSLRDDLRHTPVTLLDMILGVTRRISPVYVERLRPSTGWSQRNNTRCDVRCECN